MESHDKGAKLTAADSYGWTPLHHAARLGKKEVVRYLVENSKYFIYTVQLMKALTFVAHRVENIEQEVGRAENCSFII